MNRPAMVAILTVQACWPILGLAQPLPTAVPEKVRLSPERLARIGKVLAQEVDQGHMPGAVLAIARRGKLVYFEAFGYRDREAGAPMPKDALFRIRSMSKPFVSVATLMLLEEGRLQLWRPVSDWLPAFKRDRVSVAQADAATGGHWKLVPVERDITIQDLLRHTSGIAGADVETPPVRDAYAAGGLAEGDEPRLLGCSELSDHLARAPLAHQPGRAWTYGYSTEILGCVVEAASGMRLSRFLDEKIFRPLGMRDTAFRVAPDKAGRLAQPLRTDGAGKPVSVIDVSRDWPRDSGAMGAISTAADYLRFEQLLLNGGALDGVRLLSRPVVTWMTSNHLGPGVAGPGPGAGFGLGFMVQLEAGVTASPGSAGTYGWGGDYGTAFFVDPKEQLIAVFLTQAPGSELPRLQSLLRPLVYQAVAD
jgi:CubicO group peptidase (beta-lactamase class C family)